MEDSTTAAKGLLAIICIARNQCVCVCVRDRLKRLSKTMRLFIPGNQVADYTSWGLHKMRTHRINSAFNQCKTRVLS